MDNRCILENEEELDINGPCEGIYPMDGIKVDKGFYTVFELKRRYDAKEKRIKLDSDFQREDVWGTEKKAELVESVLMGLPLPVFYFNQDKYGRLIVVDGRQRLTALFQYMDNKFSLRKLKIMPKLNGLYFSDLSPVLQSRIEDFQIHAHVIMPPTPDRIKFDIFDRVNRGGMQLNKQEIRNALYQGRATQVLAELVKSQEFADATGNAFLNEKRMKDKYLLTRFITFYLYRSARLHQENGKPYFYRDDIDELLGRGMDTVNQMDDAEAEELMDLVKAALRKSFYYLGSDAFRLRREGRRSPVNMNVFETLMYMMIWLPENNSTIRVNVQGEVAAIVNNEKFRDNIGNHRDSAVKLNWRLDLAEHVGRTIGNS